MPLHGLPRFGRKQGARDSQRQKVYSAEGAIPTGLRFKTVPEMQTYVDKLLASAWARRRWGNRNIEVKPGFGHRRATGGYGSVQMPTWARTENTLLHEVGHNLAGGDAWHDPKFVRVMVELVGHVFGAEALGKFRQAIREERVRVGPAIKLRSAERTPPAPKPLADVNKLWRVEYKQKGEVKTTEIHAATMVGALARFVTLQQRSPGEGEITNVRAWRGRPTVSRVKVKRAAKKPPATLAQVKTRAAALGATVDVTSSDIEVTAPRRFEWADEPAVHSLVAVASRRYRADAYVDLLERMQAGIVPCGAECEAGA